MKGENFRAEYKYPIKIYRIGQSVEFANGLELRKLILSIVLALIMIVVFIIMGIKGDTNILSFIAKNWLILLTIIPAIVSFVVFNLDYDGKGFIAYFRDRFAYYKNRKKAYEHFIEVPREQMDKALHYESFSLELNSKGGNSIE